jgi:hypothetical protein
VCERKLHSNGYEWAWVGGSGKDTGQATRDKSMLVFLKRKMFFYQIEIFCSITAKPGEF